MADGRLLPGFKNNPVQLRSRATRLKYLIPLHRFDPSRKYDRFPKPVQRAKPKLNLVPSSRIGCTVTWRSIELVTVMVAVQLWLSRRRKSAILGLRQ